MSKDLQENPTVFIYIRGGVVQDVDCPEGVNYRVVDYDNDTLPQFRADRVSGGVLIASEEFYDLASCSAYLEGYGGVVNMQDDDGNWQPLSNAGRETDEEDSPEPDDDDEIIPLSGPAFDAVREVLDEALDLD